MKLFLGGGGKSTDSLTIDSLFAKALNPKKPLLYIPIAMPEEEHPFPECFAWINTTFNPLGVKNIVMWTDLKGKTSKDVEPFSGIYIGGGNTFSLLHDLKNTKFLEILKQAAKKEIPMYGGSAGALILGKTITLALNGDENKVHLKDFSSLNLVHDYDIDCHYKPSSEEIIKELITTYHLQKVLAIPEDGGLIVTEKEIKVIGPGSTMLFEGNKKIKLAPGKIF